MDPVLAATTRESFDAWIMENMGPKGITGWVYFAGQPIPGDKSLVKIGYTTDLPARWSYIRTANGNCDLLLACRGSRFLERALHQRFKSSRVRNEWFEFCDELYWTVFAFAQGNEDGTCDTIAPFELHRQLEQLGAFES